MISKWQRVLEGVSLQQASLSGWKSPNFPLGNKHKYIYIYIYELSTYIYATLVNSSGSDMLRKSWLERESAEYVYSTTADGEKNPAAPVMYKTSGK